MWIKRRGYLSLKREIPPERGRRDIERPLSDLRIPTPKRLRSRKSEASPLLVPIRRQPRVVHELACRQFRRMLPTQDCAQDIRCQQREPEKPRGVGRRHVLRFGNFIQRQALVLEEPRSNRLTTNENPDHAGFAGLNVLEVGFSSIMNGLFRSKLVE